MESANQSFKDIQGWGADLDPDDRPAHPKERTPPLLEGIHWDQPAQQISAVEILVSNERPGITPVYGTSVPPSGLSGILRRRAFKRSENDLRHWLTLMFADRVNVVEGLLGDVRKTPRGRRLVAGALVLGIVGYLLSRSRSRPRLRYR